MAVNPNIKLTVYDNSDDIIITDSTGDYNAVSNPLGWDSTGSVTYARTNPPVTAININIYAPGSSTITSTGSLLATTFFTGSSRAYQLYTDPSNVLPSISLTDGVWRYDVIYTINSNLVTVTKYSLRVNSLKCSIGQLALTDMEVNNFEEIKITYDKMVQAFECGEYTLAQSLYDDINDMLTDCSPYSINSCGC